MKLELEINKGRIADLLCCAFEGGSNYWAWGQNIYDAPDILWQELAGWDFNVVYPHCHYALFAGGKYGVRDAEEDINYTLDLDKIKSGLKIMAEKYPRHFGNWLSEDDDAITGDVFLQCCLFGEVKYG